MVNKGPSPTPNPLSSKLGANVQQQNLVSNTVTGSNNMNVLQMDFKADTFANKFQPSSGYNSNISIAGNYL